MHYVADLHLHSKYSRAVSMNMILPTMAQVAKQKGLNILSAADWTHPLWFKEIHAQLEEASEGLFRLKSEYRNSKEVLFLLSTEISSIYSQNGKLRRIHNLVFVPSFETAEKISKELIRRGCNLMADGRPIIGMSSRILLELVLEIDERAILIPCHIWTPHFGIYGSASGFNSLEEAFGNLAPHIYGIETGLSSDPEMNWEVPELMHRSILSFSDAHSPAKMGREATVFDLETPTYENIRKAIMRPSVHGSQFVVHSKESAVNSERITNNRIVYTIEFYPEEGKYHFSGHRNCKIVRGPEELRKDGEMCPVCNKKLTEGVLVRVRQLGSKELLDRADEKMSPLQIKWHTDKRHNQPPYVKLVPLLEIVAESMEATVLSVKVKAEYIRLVEQLGTEIDILLKIPSDEIEKVGGKKLADGILKVRGGTIAIDPGYDGEYGKVRIFSEEKKVEEVEKVEKVEDEKEKAEEEKEQLGFGI